MAKKSAKTVTIGDVATPQNVCAAIGVDDIVSGDSLLARSTQEISAKLCERIPNSNHGLVGQLANKEAARLQRMFDLDPIHMDLCQTILETFGFHHQKDLIDRAMGFPWGPDANQEWTAGLRQLGAKIKEARHDDPRQWAKQLGEILGHHKNGNQLATASAEELPAIVSAVDLENKPEEVGAQVGDIVSSGAEETEAPEDQGAVTEERPDDSEDEDEESDLEDAVEELTDDENEDEEKPGADEEEPENVVEVWLPLAHVYPYEDNPRRTMDPKKMQELIEDLRNNPQRQAIRVRRHPDPNRPDDYQAIGGHRRCHALKKAGKTQVRAVIEEIADDDMYMEALMDNEGREDLDVVDEALAIVHLVENWKGPKAAMWEDIALKLGKSVGWVKGRAKLGLLPEEIHDRMRLKKWDPQWISNTVGMELAKIKDSKVQLRILSELEDEQAGVGTPNPDRVGLAVKQHLDTQRGLGTPAEASVGGFTSRPPNIKDLARPFKRFCDHIQRETQRWESKGSETMTEMFERSAEIGPDAAIGLLVMASRNLERLIKTLPASEAGRQAYTSFLDRPPEKESE